MPKRINFFELFGINKEYVITVSKNSDGSKKEEKEPRFRLVGFMDMYMGEELAPLNAIRKDLEKVKKERAEMNRTLDVMNKSPFSKFSVFLLIIAIILLSFGILTLSKILPLPEEQIGIAVALVIFGSLALIGSILVAVFRGKKKRELLTRKEEILRQDQDLQNREAEIDSKVPQWYKNALWSAEGYVLRNATQRYELK